MIQKPLLDRVASADVAGVAQSRLTIFAIPKKFEGHVGVIQRNAIRSWAQLQPHVDIILFGQDDPELDRIAAEVDARCVPLRMNEHGTPILADAFSYVHENSNCPVKCYANCDIVFGTELLEATERLRDAELGSFLGIGQRSTLQVTSEYQPDEADRFEQLIQQAAESGELDSVVCKDYFLYSEGLYSEIPGFLVGRGNWDNWMVANAKSNGVPVVDLTAQLTAVHQHHDYTHVTGGRRKAYVSGVEAKENQALAGGRNLIRGSTATWELSEKGAKRRRLPWLGMVTDLPKFVTLLRNLLILGYMLASTALTY